MPFYDIVRYVNVKYSKITKIFVIDFALEVQIQKSGQCYPQHQHVYQLMSLQNEWSGWCLRNSLRMIPDSGQYPEMRIFLFELNVLGYRSTGLQ